MFVINLHYIAPLEQIDAHMADHMRFINVCYQQGIFVASGRKVPRTGGIILAHNISRKELEIVISEDPFYKHKLAEITITEFQTSQVHADFKKLLK